MQIDYIEGDLISLAKEGSFDVVAHGANCFHTMGAGIAPLLNNMTDGNLLIADRRTAYGDINKLGAMSFTRQAFAGRLTHVVNIYTQYVISSHFRSGVTLVNWNALEKGLRTILTGFGPNVVVGIPLIGCGLAKGPRVDFEHVLTNLQNDPTLDGRIVVVDYKR